MRRGATRAGSRELPSSDSWGLACQRLRQLAAVASAGRRGKGAARPAMRWSRLFVARDGVPAVSRSQHPRRLEAVWC